MNSPATSRNPWPIAIIAFFVVFITFILSFIAFAARQKVELVRSDYYDEEMRFQQQLDRLNRTHPINAQIAVTYDASQQRLTVTLPAAHARHTVTGRIQFYRPSDASLDQDIPLAVNADGVQQVDTKTLRAGLWKVRVSWKADDQEYFFGQSIVIDSRASSLHL
jgi:nitrogen fixation protein FixH